MKLRAEVLLRTSSFAEMLTPAKADRGQRAPFDYGFGWFVESYAGRRDIHHGGGTPGFSSIAIDTPLCATHADTLRGILEFLKSIGKLEQTVIAESSAGGPTFEGFDNYGYNRFANEYGVRLVDLDQDELELLHVFDEKDFRPHPMRTCRTLLDPDSFVISVTRFKTQDRVVATLSLKNIVVGAPIKDAGFRWGRSGRPGAKNDKPIVHGRGFRGLNWNLFALAPRLHPHLAVLDGVEGMQGNGPVAGTPVDHRVCVVSPDWLAADRVAVE